MRSGASFLPCALAHRSCHARWRIAPAIGYTARFRNGGEEEAVAQAPVISEAQPVREVVALFETRSAFDHAVEALLTGGFSRADISVLASHTSLEAAEVSPPPPTDEALTGLVGELTYAFPLATAGLIAIIGGPITGTVAALVAAGVGGLAIKEYLDELTSHPDTDAFAEALESGGVIVWVQAPADEAVQRATAILTAEGGLNVHLAEREG
jgi:hypothetical protein